MTHAGGSCRVTVVGSRRRVDLTVPGATAVIDLLPQLVQLTGEADASAAPAGWLLTRLGGQPLAAERTLDEAGVVDGELLYLQPADGAPAPPLVEDFSEAVAQAVEAAGGKWTARRSRQLLEGLAGALWLAAAVATLRLGGPGDAPWAATALADAVGLGAVAAALAWWLRRPLAGAVAAAAAVPFWALAGAYLASAAGQPAPLARLAAAGAGVLAGAGIAWLVAPRLRQPAAALALAVAPLAAAGAAVQFRHVTAVQAAGVLAIAVLAAITVLPRLAAGLAGLTRPRESSSAIAELAVEPAASSVRRLLVWLLVAASVDLGAALAVLAFSPDGAARALCAGALVSVALRARHHRFVAEVLPLALVAAAGALLLAIALTAGAGADAQLAVLLGAGGALLGLAWLPVERASSPHVRRWLSRLEVVANATLVPLALAAGGVFAAAADVGRRIASA